MANDSEDVKSVFDFHPCDTPRGMLYYNLSELTNEQQKLLNEHKLDVIRNNEQYLHEHPEIKIVTSMILRAILKERPKVNVQEYLAKYLSESWRDIKMEVDKCIAERELREAMTRILPSAASILKGLQFERSEGYPEEEYQQVEDVAPNPLETQLMCKGILDDLIDNLAVDKRASKCVSPKKSSSSDFSLASFISYPSRHYSPPHIDAACDQ